MASSQSAKPNAPSSLVRFNSARVAPSSIEMRSLSPSELHVDDGFFPSLKSPPQSPFGISKFHPNTRITPINDDNDAARTVKISEYTVPENTPFEPLTPSKSPPKLHRYILVTPRNICFFALLAVVSIAVAAIGFGVVVARQRAQLDFTCPSISYCPRNTSYTVLCNTTDEGCGCYNHQDALIGCLKQRRYGEGCYRAQECSSHYNLQCNASTYLCECLDHYYYNGSACVPLLTYGAACSVGNNTCDYWLNLACLTGSVCTCDTSVAFWNGEYCESYRTAGQPCDPFKSPSGCSMTFICDNLTATCQCPMNAYFDGRACLIYSSYLEPCYNTLSCLPNTYLTCSWGVCQCDDLYFYWSITNSTCLYPKQTQFNASCDYQSGCESDFGLRCINGRCACEVNSYWTPGNYCDAQSQYNEQCLTAPCLGNTGLLCSSNTSTCICPQCKFPRLDRLHRLSRFRSVLGWFRLSRPTLALLVLLVR